MKNPLDPALLSILPPLFHTLSPVPGPDPTETAAPLRFIAAPRYGTPWLLLRPSVKPATPPLPTPPGIPDAS